MDPEQSNNRTLIRLSSLSMLAVVIVWSIATIIAFVAKDPAVVFEATNVLFSGLAFACLIITLYMQRQELIAQRLEFSKSVQELARQALSAEATNEIQLYLKLIEVMDSVAEERDSLEKYLLEQLPDGVLSLNTSELKKMEKLAHKYDSVAFMVQQKLLPIKFIEGFYTRPIVVGWEFIHPIIERTRTERRQPTHMWSFEMLAVNARRTRLQKYPKEKMFVVTTAQEKAASEWYKLLSGHAP